MPSRIRNILGVFLIVLGIILLPVPVIPGLPIIAAGAAVLGPHHPIVVSFRNRFRPRSSTLRRESNEPANEAALD